MQTGFQHPNGLFNLEWTVFSTSFFVILEFDSIECRGGLMKKLLLIYNPVSGDGRIRSGLSELINLFTAQGYLVTTYPTQKPRDAWLTLEHLENDREQYERIVVCGGDGMMHEALNGWMHGRDMPPLGYIPSGTVNDFANSYGIPKDLQAAALTACTQGWTSLDTGCFNDEYFTYVAAFGVGTSVSYQTPQRRKQIFGSAAYIIEALSTVDFAHWENNCETMEINWEGGSAQGDFLYGMVSNSKYVAGSDLFTRDLFNWHDGLLEGVFFRRPMNLNELNQIIGCLVRSDFNNPICIQVQSPWFEFRSSQTDWTLDGEYGGTHDFVRVEAVPKTLRMILPPEHLDHPEESAEESQHHEEVQKTDE